MSAEKAQTLDDDELDDVDEFDDEPDTDLPALKAKAAARLAAVEQALVVAKAWTPEQKIRYYAQMRDEKKRIQAALKLQIAPIHALLVGLEGQMRTYMEAAGLKNLPIVGFTASEVNLPKAAVKDADLFLEFCRGNDLMYLMERRANATAVHEYIVETKQCPPGIDFSIFTTVRVTKTKVK